jgi:hypothetical protein
MRGRNNNGGGGGNNNNNNNNNRKGPNPLTRNYESNGPDVKIRGSAQQIAEKYTTLARDAQSSGDRVVAENYLQHAEHYNRIIAAAQAQMPIQNVQNNRDDFDDDGDEDREAFDNSGDHDVSAPTANHGTGPQPVIDGTPAEIALNTEGGRESGGNREGGGRQRERRPNAGSGQNGQRGDYQARGDQNGHRSEQARRNEAPVSSEALVSSEVPAVVPFEAAPSIAVTAPAPEPVAAPVAKSENLSPADLAARAELNEAANEAAAPRRPRRPRRPRVSADAVASDDNAGEAPAQAGASEPAVSEG